MWPNPQETVDLVITEEILNGKLHFLCSVFMYDLIYHNSVDYIFMNSKLLNLFWRGFTQVYWYRLL